MPVGRGMFSLADAQEQDRGWIDRNLEEMRALTGSREVGIEI